MDSLTLNASVQISASALVNRDLGSTIPFNPSIKRVFNAVFGTGLKQVNQIYEKALVLNTNTQLLLSLFSGAGSAGSAASGTYSQMSGIQNWINEPINLTVLKMLWIENFSPTDTLLVSTGGGSVNGLLMTLNPVARAWSKIILPPKSGMLFASDDIGWAVDTGNGWLGFSSGPTAATNVGLLIAGVNS